MFMNAFTCFAICFVSLVGAGVYLIVHDSPWWAALCFFFLTACKIKSEGGSKS